MDNILKRRGVGSGVISRNWNKIINIIYILHFNKIYSIYIYIKHIYRERQNGETQNLYMQNHVYEDRMALVFMLFIHRKTLEDF